MGNRIRFVLGLSWVLLCALAGVAVAGFGPSQGGGGSGSSSSSTSFPLLAPDGSSGAPSYSFSSATGTGMYENSPSNLSFATNGTEKVRILAGGDMTMQVPNALISWSGRSVLRSTGDGAVLLQNNAGTGFTSLNFGSTTSSFPELKVNGTAINFRLGDDSGDCPITASTAGFSGAVTISTNTILSNFGTGVLGLSDSTTGTAFRVFNTTDSTSSPTNAEWIELSWSANAASLKAVKAGTGTLRGLTVLHGDASASTPSIAFGANTDRGLFNDTVNTGIGFAVGGSQKATLTGANLTLNSGVTMTVNSAAAYEFSTRSKITSSADGIVVLSNNAVSDFTRLDFGGTTSSFPALRRASTGVDCVLADNSAYAPYAALSYSLGGASKISGATDGIILLSNNAASSFTRLQFGGTGNSTPALRTNGTGLECVTSDASGFSNFGCANLVTNGTGTLALAGKCTTYSGTATAGWGVPAIYASGRAAAQAASAATLINAFAVPAADTSYMVTANALITTLGSGNFTMTVAYTDESNAARTATLNFQVVAGTVGTAISTAAPYMGQTIRIRCKASTTITVATTGTFTGCTYNAEASLLQIS